MEASWDLDNWIGFLASWSAVKKLVKTQGEEAFDEQLKTLKNIWGKRPERREIRWPLHFRIGKME